MVSRLGKEGCWRKALEIYQSLPQTGVRPDTAITNAAISACDKGMVLSADNCMEKIVLTLLCGSFHGINEHGSILSCMCCAVRVLLGLLRTSP